MIFRRFSAGKQVFGSANLEDHTMTIRSDVSLLKVLSDSDSVEYRQVKWMLRHLTLCHTVIINPKSGEYNASSPDELALIQGAKELGALFISKGEDNICTINLPNDQ